MSLRDEHLAKALKYAPDSDLAPSELVRKNVLDYANKNSKQVSQYQFLASPFSLSAKALSRMRKPHKNWLAGWLPDMKNWQWAGMSSLAVALLAVIMLREQLPEELTRRDDAPKVLAQNQAKVIPEKTPEQAPEKEAHVEADAASATMLQEKAKAREKLEPPIAAEMADKTVIAATPEAVAPPSTQTASAPESKAEAPAEQALAKQDAEKDTPKDNSIVAETRARTEAAPASDSMTSAEHKGALEKPAAAAKKSAPLGNARQDAKEDASTIGVAKAKQDIQAGVLRILVLEWPANKPLLDEATGYRVELATDLAPAELSAYNQTVRDWFKTQH